MNGGCPYARKSHRQQRFEAAPKQGKCRIQLRPGIKVSDMRGRWQARRSMVLQQCAQPKVEKEIKRSPRLMRLHQATAVTVMLITATAFRGRGECGLGMRRTARVPLFD